MSKKRDDDKDPKGGRPADDATADTQTEPAPPPPPPPPPGDSEGGTIEGGK